MAEEVNPPHRRPPVPLPRKNIPQKQTSTEQNTQEAIAKPQGKAKGAYSKIKSILGKQEVEKPKVPPRPSARPQQPKNIYPQGSRHQKQPPRSGPNVNHGSRKGKPGELNRTSATGPARPISTPYEWPSQSNVISASTKGGKISSHEQLLEVSQAALEMSIKAKRDAENSKYLEASKKYQECLSEIDRILETPLRKLNPSTREMSEAEKTVLQMKRLRKHVLLEFSDAQSAYCLPSNLEAAPTEAPPSYNDVLMEDLLENNQESSGALPVLLPSAYRESLRSDDTGMLNSSSAKRNDISSGTSGDSIDAMKEHPLTSGARPAVRKKIRPIEPTKRKPTFPDDVGAHHIQRKNLPLNLLPQSKSVDSIPDSEFVTAQSTPIMSPMKQGENNDKQSTELMLDEVNHYFSKPNSAFVDPFLHKNPFASEFEAPVSFNYSDIFDESNLDYREEAVSQEVSYLTESFDDVKDASNAASNPFTQADSKSENISPALGPEREVAKTEDIFEELTQEMRKKLYGHDGETSAAHGDQNQANINFPKVSKTNNGGTQSTGLVTFEQPTDEKVVNQSTNLETSYCKRNQLSKSVMNLPESVTSTPNYANRHPLTRLKKMSRSNESLLRMFDPIRANGNVTMDRSLRIGEEHEAARSMDRNEDEFASQISMAEHPTMIEVSDNTNDIFNQNESPDEELNNSPDVSDTRRSLYPSIPIIELGGSANTYEPSKVELSEPQSGSASFSDNVHDERNKKTSMTTKNIVGPKPNMNNAPTKPGRKKVSSIVRFNNPEETQEEKDSVTIGRSAFYSQEDSSSPNTSTEPRDVAEAGGRDAAQWQEIFHVRDAVKLFFLSSAGVSSPFNRQTIQLLRKTSTTRSSPEKARLEVGGELFARNFEEKKTRVLMDRHGDYIIEAAEGVFICLAPTSKLKASQVQDLEKAFEIYTHMAREPRSFSLGGNVDRAANNIGKAMPSVSKATKFMKSHSVRAMKKLRSAIGTEETQQEIGPEFAALQDASATFRQARNSKLVNFF
ncbi:uncharacterized protein LOC108675363 [Hyalella azteca]|uniref:Uncharacterized protein LOC108675363 n=1 Tax=Hyalella azteca TaxID=294128 RepID=A0A8B7NYS5_HYAAZ|nr:uncharacterized protein LOC108675363 [Hyalella azteca]